MNKAALLSVSDKTGIVEFARGLKARSITVFATGGTGRLLAEEGVEFVTVEEYTGQPEILGGRVKTLHPKIHGGLLARQDDSEHVAQLEEAGILPIVIAAINLYPFEEHLRSESAEDPLKMVEQIDIGGPTMIRAAAKNYRSVIPVIDPSDYGTALELLDMEGGLQQRHQLAAKVFTRLASYNLQIAKYFGSVEMDDAGEAEVDKGDSFRFGESSGEVLGRVQELRYGENPRQKACFYKDVSTGEIPWEQLNGKELSYNNLLDFDSAFRMVQSLKSDFPMAVIVKHLNPCGAAVGKTLVDALKRAKLSDPRSHFGGVIALNKKVCAETAAEVTADFTEIVVAPDFDEDALEVLKKKKNLRVVKIDSDFTQAYEYRSVAGGTLLQECDPGVSPVVEADLMSSREPSEKEQSDLLFAWQLCAHVKSNAIVLVKDGLLLAAGAGQMSRIDALEVAINKAKMHGHDLTGAVAASDAFFPFPDCVTTMAKEGVVGVIVPKGSKGDDDTVIAANEFEVSLYFTEDRHFRH